jgi:probable rRNA maturation factor
VRAQRAARLRGEVDILITDDAAMRDLNRRFRRKDAPTDVLSFPPASNGAPGAPHIWAGDIAISAEIAASNAKQLGHSLTDELKVLILHGLLHLAGYDHETDRGEMASKEERLRRALRLTGSLTARKSSTILRRKGRTFSRRRSQ